MKSKNPRHNSVRIVRRDYRSPGTCSWKCSALEKHYFCLSMQLHIILQKHAFCKKKEKDKNKTKQKTKRPLKNYILFIVKFCCGDDWNPHPDNFAEMYKLSNPRYFILIKCFPSCVLEGYENQTCCYWRPTRCNCKVGIPSVDDL